MESIKIVRVLQKLRQWLNMWPDGFKLTNRTERLMMRRHIEIRKMASRVRIAVIVAIILRISGSAGAKIDAAKWTHFTIADPLPGSAWGTGGIPLADFDRDGDLDIFAGEQEDPDTYMEAQGKLAMKPRGLKERCVIWENSGSKIPSFVPVVIHVDNPGWHDAVLADVDGNGDTDIVT
ncbi:MAG: VCBS repeat-containing protein [Sedimentisphaerales bacterium]